VEFGKEHAKSETLARELESARTEVEKGSALPCGTRRSIVSKTNSANAKQQDAVLANQHDHAASLNRELTSLRNEFETQISALNAPLAPHSPTADSSQVHTTGSASKQMKRTSAHKNAFLPLPQHQLRNGRCQRNWCVRGRSRPRPRNSFGSRFERRHPDGAKYVCECRCPIPVDEQRLPAPANALLREADISGPRPLLEHPFGLGRARAAFMLAETYDARVLQSWRARGISEQSYEGAPAL
jgi:hypothetical protein